MPVANSPSVGILSPSPSVPKKPPPRIRPRRKTGAFYLYRNARIKEIKASGVGLPAPYFLSWQLTDEWIRDLSLQHKFRNLADKLNVSAVSQGGPGAVSKIPARRKNEKAKTNKNVKKTKLVARATLPSVVPSSTFQSISFSFASPLETAESHSYSPPSWSPRDIPPVFPSLPESTSLQSDHVSGAASNSENISSSSLPGHFPFACAGTAPSPCTRLAPGLSYMSHYPSHAGLARIRPGPVCEGEGPQLFPYIGRDEYHCIPAPGLHSFYPSSLPSMPPSHIFEPHLQPANGFSPLYHPTPRPRPPSFPFLPPVDESLRSSGGGLNDVVYDPPVRVPNPLRWMAYEFVY